MTDSPTGELSRFQAMCERELVAALSAAGRFVEGRTLTPDRLGGTMVAGRVSASGVEFWIYSDGADVSARGEGPHFEWQDWDSPGAMAATFVAAVLSLVDAGRSGAVPDR